MYASAVALMVKYTKMKSIIMKKVHIGTVITCLLLLKNIQSETKIKFNK